MSRWIVAFGCLLPLLGSSASAAELRAGAAAIDISPKQYPVLINGGMTSRSATKLSDPIHARAIVFDDGKTKLAVCVVDNCLFPRKHIDPAKAEASKLTGIPAENMLVSATHTHSAPSVMGALGTEEDPNYPPVMREGIARAIAEAYKNLEPAKVAWGVADANEYVAMRRWIRRSDRKMKSPFGDQDVLANMHPGHLSVDAVGPSGPEDPALTVLSVQAADGRPIALMGNIGMHYFSGPAPVSADYFGIFCGLIEKELGAAIPAGKPKFVGLLSQGTSGDCWRRDYTKPKPEKEITIDEYAGGLAKLALAAVANKQHQSVDLAMAAADIRIKARAPSPERIEWAKKMIAEMGDRLPKTQPEVYAKEVPHLVNVPEADMLLQAIRIGDFGLTAMPNEVYALTGLKIKAQSPLAGTMNVELANDELGYIPPPEQHPMGGYTTWPARSSYPAVDTEPKMVETVLTLLEKVAGKPRIPMDQTPGHAVVGDYGKAVLASKPIAYWRMNEMSPVPAKDQVSGQLAKYEPFIAFWLEGPQSDAFSGKGVVNRSPHFAGGRMVIDTGKKLTGDYSVEFWLWNGFPAEGRAVAGYVLSRGTDGDKTAGESLGIGGTDATLNAAGKLFIYNGDGAKKTLVGRTPLSFKAWNHVVFVRAGARVHVYLNGNADPEISGELESTVNGAGTIFLGGRNDSFTNLEGKLDEAAIYDRALTGTEAAAHFRAAAVLETAVRDTGFQPVQGAPERQGTVNPQRPDSSKSGAAEPTSAERSDAPSTGWKPVSRTAVSETAAAATQPAAISGMRLSKPLSPEESAKLHVVKAGYELELVAAEPMVMDPVAFTWGSDGRMWVAEMSDYPYGSDGKMKACGRVRYLQDTDGDGKFDKSVVFADGLNFPTGLLPWRDGVLVTAAPDMLLLRDTNNDGIADVKEVLYTGFTEGNPQLRVNSPQFGLDNWVYLANGVSSKGEVTSLKTGAKVQVSGRDIRIRPDTGEIETETGTSQFGRKMADNGEWFGVHNSYPGRHFVIPERYSKRNPHASLPQNYYDLGFSANPKVYPLSQGQKRYGTAFFAQSGRFTSACGMTPYRDTLLTGAGTSGGTGEPQKDGVIHLFTCEPVHNLIQHNVLKPAGSTYVAERSPDELDGEFLASKDEWFRPVYLTTGPDGALYIADMYRFMIEHPDWLPAEGKEDYRPYYRLGEDLGRIWRVKPKGSTLPPIPNLARLSTPELVKALESSNGWQRDLAQAMLVWEKSGNAVLLLQDLALLGKSPYARLHAMWALEGTNNLTTRVAEKAMTDEHPAVRRAAVRFAENRADASPTYMNALRNAITDPDAGVRLQLAYSLGQINMPAAGETLAKLALSAGDDVYLTAAVMTSAHVHTDALATAMLGQAAPPTALMRDLQAMALAKGDRDLLAKLLLPILGTKGGRYTMPQLVAFREFLDVLGQQKTSVAKLGGKGDALSDLLTAAPDAFAAGRVVAGAMELPVEKRLIGISLLGRDGAHLTDDLKQLSAIYAPAAPAAIQLAAVRALSTASAAEVPGVLLSRWADRPAEVRSAAVDVLLTREPWTLTLLERLKSGEVPATDFDATRKQRLARSKSAKIKDLASAVFGDLGVNRSKVVETYRPAATLAGDAARGQKIYQANCATCHKVGSEGVEIGPNLASIAGWPPEALLTAILDPSRSAEPRYLAYTATLDTGEAVYGILLRETPAGVTIKGLDGKERDIPRKQIKSLECANRSLMPDGIESAVDAQQMADLMQFLHSQKP
ncbi:PVC-type heme-binding CxxCH protein [Humisphaera borealis]|uniref:HEAT repeat domain-containing protein n=1 Tax=Humisphaera borealis TaxID=2807512 RepID=A0A7M2X3L7_9BACT|nr:PVC-type heme-binding CxxCH protein [Humisphaera borealis]QOV91360.1 HEAT repeat domain-containing protein [Humisphaera borealis]